MDNEPFFLTYKTDNAFQIVNINKVYKGEPDFIAKVKYLATNDGGRKGYAASGSRPHIKFDGRQQMTSGEHLFIDKDKVFPGDIATAEIRILSPHFFENYLFAGRHFDICEDLKIVGQGEVLKIINPKLQY